MQSLKSDEELLETIKQFGLTAEEAVIYFTLIKFGKTGAIVKKLVQETSIGRTTIYAILNRLIEKGAVIKGGPSNTAKKAQLFLANEPIEFFNRLIEQQKKQIEELEERNLLHHDHFQRLYQEGFEFTFEKLDPFIQPYLRRLILEKGWTVISQIVERGMQTFGCDVFAYELRISESDSEDDDYRNSAHFVIYAFDYDIETNDTSRKFFIDLARRKTQESIRVRGHFNDVQVEDGEITLLGKTWPAFSVRVQIDQQYMSLEMMPIFPIKNKLIFISTGLSDSLEALTRAVYKVEKIPLGTSAKLKKYK